MSVRASAHLKSRHVARKSRASGDPEDARNNPLYQYQSVAQCIDACSKFDMAHPYSTTAMGDSLACRLNEAVQAAISVMPDGAMHCSSTAGIPTGACVGTTTQ